MQRDSNHLLRNLETAALLGEARKISSLLDRFSSSQSASSGSLLPGASLLGSLSGPGTPSLHRISEPSLNIPGYNELSTSLSARSVDPLILASEVAAKRQLQQIQLAKLAATQHDDMLNEAYARGREEALLSLLGSRTEAPKIVLGHNVAKPVEKPNLNNYARKQPEHAYLDSSSAKPQNSGYFDASCLKDPDPVLIASRRARGGVTEPFPEKLHRMLKDVEKRGDTDIIAFFSHGRAFAIHNQVRFVSEIMPKYFRQSRLSSFQRQLNIYGFKRITSGPDAGGYYHELFLKDRPTLAVHMRRVGVKGTKKTPPPSERVTGSKDVSNADQEISEDLFHTIF